MAVNKAGANLFGQGAVDQALKKAVGGLGSGQEAAGAIRPVGPNKGNASPKRKMKGKPKVRY